VIINVTGGPDLSLMEVNEASLLIQEAAHEDANIIFGAVVDPKLEGRVKVTVIATGFDSPTAVRSTDASGIQTPVDLHHYSVLRTSAGSGRSERAETRQATDAPAPAVISRRPPLDLASTAFPPPTAQPPADAGDIALDSLLTFDVPAFLRREG
jgi:cell division protein FtsZ